MRNIRRALAERKAMLAIAQRLPKGPRFASESLYAHTERSLCNQKRDWCIFSRMKSWVAFLLLISPAVAFGQGKPYPKAQTPAAVGQMPPDFTLKDQDGKDFRLSDQRGQSVLLYFYRGYW